MQNGNFTIALDELPVPRVAVLLGLDVGSKRIGVAVSDPGRIVANPLTIVKRDNWRKTAATLKKIIAETHAQGVIVGYPLHMDGSEGTACQSVRAFCRNLHRDFSLPISLWDERLTTTASHKHLTRTADVSRKKQGQVIDAVAAALILQGALDYLRNNELQ